MAKDTKARPFRPIKCLPCEQCCYETHEETPFHPVSTHKFTWIIPNARRLIQKAHATSNIFKSGDQTWRLHVHVFQSKQRRMLTSHIAVYVEWRPPDRAPPFHYIHFNLALKNSKNENLVYHQRCSHRFIPSPHGGFTLFVPMERILEPGVEWTSDYGFSIKFRIYDVTPPKATELSLQFGTYGFSILSVFAVAVRYLYNLAHFRRVVERSRPKSRTGDAARLLHALKKIFDDMTFGVSHHIDLMMLFKAYGSHFRDLGKVFEFWEFFQYFTWRMASFWDRLEDSPFHLLFFGNYIHSFRSISVTHLREFEVFQLDTMDSVGFLEALNNSCTLEDGQPIKSQPEAHPVKRDTQFSQFPPVLRLILKRFKYDTIQRKNLKMMHSFEFPMDLNINRSTFHYLAVSSTGFKEHTYKLNAVIAHEGNSIKTGYYVLYLRSKEDHWMKVSDNNSIMTEAQVMESCSRSACFLSYVRMSDWDWVMN